MSFGGIPAAQVVQDYYLWEWLLNETPCRGIVELGTWEGGFSWYLAAQARCRGLAFRTYDVRAPEHEVPGFVQLDVFREREQVGRYLTEHNPVILFCDGGNKARELKIFSPFLSPDSRLVVHDWGTEMDPADVPDGLTMLHEELYTRYGSMSRVFRRD